MTHPRRKLTPSIVRQIRADYRARRDAERQLAEARRVLETTPDAMNWARSLRCTQNIILSAAQGRTYKEIQ